MKLMVIDGNSIINRSFYGIRPLTTRDGTHTNAVYGFLTTMQRILCVSLSTVQSPPSGIWNMTAIRRSAMGCPKSWPSRCPFSRMFWMP